MDDVDFFYHRGTGGGILGRTGILACRCFYFKSETPGRKRGVKDGGVNWEKTDRNVRPSEERQAVMRVPRKTKRQAGMPVLPKNERDRQDCPSHRREKGQAKVPVP
jgi:hypothetical protein